MQSIKTLITRTCAVALLAMAALAGPLATTTQAQSLADFEKKVTLYTLPNGLKCLFIKRDVAPVATFVTYVNAGSADDPMGYAGMAHIFEHMAFKGSRRVGTTNWEQEKPLLDEMDAAYTEWLRETRKPKPDSSVIKAAYARFTKAQDASKKFVVNNEFSQLVDNNGGQDMNAYTANDQTVYHFSLPQNKAELWFALESDRFYDGIMREFYVEKEVIREERRMRVESSPIGRFLEEFTSVALSGHPYGIRGIGNQSTISNATMAEAQKFFETYYVPNNMCIAIAGDIDVEQMKKLADKYFGRLKVGKPMPERTIEITPQRGERRFVMEDKAQPIYFEGYRTVSGTHPDNDALQLLSYILSNGRTSRMYQRLVLKEAKALNANTFQGYPGTKHMGLFVVQVVPNQGVKMDEVEKMVLEEIERVKTEGVTAEELNRARTKVRADLIRGLNDNESLAIAFAQSEMLEGSWKEVFIGLDRIQKLTPADIQRVAKKYLVKDQRTVGYLQTTAQ
jgi:predicted Zn-dependent peptidase